MNSLIETLNKWGGQFLNFAWPMAWQAGLLIVALLAFEVLFRRRVRASVRYALWLVVLVKLILPPALALPTSPAWWLHSNTSTTPIVPQIHNYTISYDSSPLLDASLKALTSFVPPKPVMIWAAWLLVLSAAVSAGLFFWLLMRWWQITRQVSRAKTSERLTAMIAQARLLAGVRGEPPVKLTANTMSPVVCGLFRPTILIPESLVEHFSGEQLRAVLLHELIHLRRRDVWLNFWQSLLQIVYWWHPLVWVANARIRRVREEAVDDAVMLALAGEAETYAPTLLEVAKLALNRPLASLGLVGILESRSALRERIERLVDFRAPRRTGLTLLSVFGVLAFSAVAVPMGGAPGSDVPTPLPAAVVANETNKTEVWLPQVYIQADFYRMSGADLGQLFADLKYKSAVSDGNVRWSATPDQLSQLNQKLKLSGFQPFASPRIQTTSGLPAELCVGNGTNSVEFDCRPFVVDGAISLNHESKMIVRTATTAMTNQFVDHVEIENHSWLVVSMKDQNDLSGSNVVVVIGAKIFANHYAQRLDGIVNQVQPSTNILSASDAAAAFGNVTNAMPSHFNQRLNGIVNRADRSTNAAAEVESLVRAAKLDYESAELYEAEELLHSALVLDPGNAAAKYYLGLIDQTRQLQQDAAPKHLMSGREKIIGKLNSIRLDRFITVRGMNLTEVIRQLSRQAKQADPEKEGVNIVTGLITDDQSAESNSISIAAMKLNQMTLVELLDAISMMASQPIKWSIMDNEIVFAAVDGQKRLFSSVFKVDSVALTIALRSQTGLPVNNAPDIAIAARSYFIKSGLDWGSPEGKSVFYNEHRGLLFVKATQRDLDVIEGLIHSFVQKTLQVHIKARFIEVPKGALAGMEKSMVITNRPSPTNGIVGILMNENFKTTLQSLERLPGAEELAEPEVTTLSGRQTQMRSTELVGVVTNFALVKNPTNDVDAVVPQTGQFETGAMLDVVPYVLADGHKLSLTLIPSFTEFLGYDTPPSQHFSSTNTSVHLPVILPHFQVRQSVVTTVLGDNQTVVLSDLPVNDYVGGKESSEKSKADNKGLVVLITATIVDDVGNRVNSDEALAAAQN